METREKSELEWSEVLEALRDLREATVDVYKIGRVAAEPFVRAGNVLAKYEND